MMNARDLKQYFNEYKVMIHDGLINIVDEEFTAAYCILRNATQPQTKSRIFVCGNGGSAAISEHFSCDHSKGVRTDTDLTPEVISLSSNMAIVTALANDLGYDQIFSKQLKYHNMKAYDVLVAISSKGSSLNVVRAIRYARMIGAGTISMVGFDGGILAQIHEQGRTALHSHALLHVKQSNYGVVEDCHQMLMHMLAQSLRRAYSKSAEIVL